MNPQLQELLREARDRSEPAPGMCGCVGPQNGQPLCPCAMRSVLVVAGRYVQTIDLGPAPLAVQLGTSQVAKHVLKP